MRTKLGNDRDRKARMSVSVAWFALGPHHGVLELDYGLELHLVFRRRGGSVAWWLLDTGAWLGEVLVGCA
jgi:hypothetical protein